MRIDFDLRDGVLVITFHGTVDVCAADELAAALQRVEDERCGAVLFDLSATRFLDVYCAGKFVAVAKTHRGSGGRVAALVSPNSVAERVLRLMNCPDLLAVSHDAAEAEALLSSAI